MTETCLVCKELLQRMTHEILKGLVPRVTPRCSLQVEFARTTCLLIHKKQKSPTQLALKDFSRKLSLGFCKSEPLDISLILSSITNEFDITKIVCIVLKLLLMTQNRKTRVDDITVLLKFFEQCTALFSCASCRDDACWNEALLRIQTESDLVSAEAKYHLDCTLRFITPRQRRSSLRKGGYLISKELMRFRNSAST